MEPKEFVKDIIIKWTKGRQLKSDLGLDQFKYAYIQKIIDLAMDVYIITVDSRFPNVYFGLSKLKKVYNTSIILSTPS